MRFSILVILLSITTFSYAQTKKKKTISSYAKPDITTYYHSQQLTIDSATSPFLYYQVYEWIGTRYKYSGETKKGIDCSGFVSKMYDRVYCISLSGGSRDIYSQVKENNITKSELKEGDILFFKIRKGQISHVGIYLGNNKFAHASVQSGVIISDLDEPYYKKYFYKAGRF
ncbi:MAG: C40 family peptidase [Bacteroidetes bacterium]|nr:C40 family peptidase [Bacteroidota bacterium]